MAHARIDAEQVWQQFHDSVNMTSRQLRDWLAASSTVFSQEAPGVAREEPEGDPTALGWRLVEVLGKRRTDLNDTDVADMRQAVEIIEDRLANRPAGGEELQEWRRNLMLLGHDPLAP